MNTRYVPLVLLIALIASSIEMDISVPGFPAMADFFATSEASIQATLSLNLLGFCIAALFFGPLADSVGRKKLMVAGFVIFGICSAGCSITNDLSSLLAYRFFQGLGASSTWVLAYAIIADLYQGKQATKYIGIINGVATAFMAIAPAMGALLCKSWGWRSTYGVIAVLSLVSLGIIVFGLPETLKERKPFHTKATIGHFCKLLNHYEFMLYTLVPSIIGAAYMAYIAVAPFLYIDQLQMSFDEYAVHQSIIIASFSFISFKSDWFVEKFGDLGAQQIGIVISMIGMAIIVTFSYLYPTNAWPVTVGMTLDSIGIAITFGIFVSKALELFPNLKGTASSLNMAIRVSFSSLGVWIGAQFYTGVMFDSMLVLVIISAIGIATNVLTFKFTKFSNALEGPN